MLNRADLFRQNGNVTAIQDSFKQMLIERERARMEDYIAAREYYDGIHRTQLTQRLREFLHVDSDADFTVNYCPMVVNAKADRLAVTGFDAPDNESTGETLWKWWRKNRCDKLQGIVHRAAIRDGDSFVLVEWDKDADMPRFYYEPAYAGEGVMVYYSDERREDIEFASKSWQIKYGAKTGKMRRINLYFPDRIEKYVSDDDVAMGHWQPFIPPETNPDEPVELRPGKLGMAAVSWWTDDGTETGEPLGVPIVHFKNNDNGDFYGTSALKKVMPVQDALNKAMIDLIATMDVAGFSLLVGLGNTSWANVKVAPGAIAALPVKPGDASLERLAGESPDGLLAVYNALVMEIARISGTPMSYFQSSGQMPAEGTMKQQEIALITQIEKAQVDFGNAWEDVMNIARKLSNAFGSATFVLDEVIDTLWKDAELRNDKELAETLAIQVSSLGVTEDMAQQELGYDATQIAEMERKRKQNQALALRRQFGNAPQQQNAQAASNTQTEQQNAMQQNGANAPPQQ